MLRGWKSHHGGLRLGLAAVAVGVIAWSCGAAKQKPEMPERGTVETPAPVESAKEAVPAWRHVSVGDERTCGIRGDGSLWCWGLTEYRPRSVEGPSTPTPQRIGKATDWRTIHLDAGLRACGLRVPGRLLCLGNHFKDIHRYEDWELVSQRTDWQTIGTGSESVCGIGMDGALRCWGSHAVPDGIANSEQEPSRLLPELKFRTVSAGGGSQCAISHAGALWCWGENNSGKLGLGHDRYVEKPTPVATQTKWQAVLVTRDSTCAIAEDGALWCWGDSAAFSGLGGTPPNSPKRVGGSTAWRQVASAKSRMCGVQRDGSLWCDGTARKLGYGPPIRSELDELGVDGLARVGRERAWLQVSVSRAHSCAIARDGSLWCWGENREGQLGDGTRSDRWVPRLVRDAPLKGDGANACRGGYAGLAVGHNHACAIRADGSAWCWGSNLHGDLGDGAGEDQVRPRRVSGSGGWRQLSAGSSVTCGTKHDGSLWCWGAGGDGQLGIGATQGPHGTVRASDQYVPARVGSDVRWRNVSVGTHSTCGTLADGSGWCWGDNSIGSVGGSQSKVFAPQRVEGDWLSLASGWTLACGIKRDESLWCWGDVEIRHRPGPIRKSTPKHVATKIAWRRLFLSTGGSHCGIDRSDKLWCWGRNLRGQLPLPPAPDVPEPTTVTLPAKWQSLSSDSTHGCGVTTAGQLWCWGDNDHGQLARTTEGPGPHPPAQLGARSDWVEVGVGVGFTCARRKDGNVLCWGKNTHGQLGDGTIEQRKTPTCIALPTPEK